MKFFLPRLPVSIWLCGLTCLFLSIAGATYSAPVRINEVMASNGSILADEDGDYEDWIELYNAGESTADLGGWGLSDNDNNPFKWSFPRDTVLEAGAHMLVWASGKDRHPEESQTGLSREVFMGIPGTQVSDLTNDPSFPSRPTSTYIVSDFFEAPTNIADNYGQRIHGTLIAPESGFYRFWIASDDNGRLYLSTDESPENARLIAEVPGWTRPRQWNKYPQQESALVQLRAGRRYYIAALMKEHGGGDNLAVRWQLPNGIIDAPVPARHFETVNTRHFHTNFALSSGGEEVVLTNSNGVRVDELPPRAIPRNISLGRFPDGDGDWFYFDQPTPGTANLTQGYLELLEAPEFSHSAGFYDEAFPLAVTHSKSSVTLRYTLDGSEPSHESPEFPEALTLRSRHREPNVFSNIKTTAGNDFWRAPQSPVFKGNVVRVRAFADGAIPSRTVSGTYFVGPNVSQRYSFPVISVVTDGDNFFGDPRGIYVAGDGYDGNWANSNYWRRGRAWERPVHLEIFEEDGSLGLAQDAGARLHGGWSRRGAFKSLRFYARSDYGNNEFAYKLFPEQPDESYKRFILRNSGNDRSLTLFRDALMQRLVRHLSFDTQAYRPAITFINGEYWGIKNMRERYDRFYLARTYGVDPDRIDLLTRDRSVKEGDATHYNAMLQYIQAHGVSDPAHYNHIRRQMDVENFIDYKIANIYLNNTDWPGNNIDFWRLRRDDYAEEAPYGHDGRWRWLSFDTDFGFWMATNTRGHPSFNTLAYATTGVAGENWQNPGWSTFLLRNMLENETFRISFINRFADQLNTAFRPERVIAMIDEMAAVVAPEIGGHILRFGEPSSMNTVTSAINRMKDFGIQRPEHQFEHILRHFNLSRTYTLSLDVNNGQYGRVRVNSLNLEPGTPGVGDSPYPWSGVYFRGVPIELEAIPAPGFQFVRWDGLGDEGSAVRSVDSARSLTATAVFEEVDPTMRQLAFSKLHRVGQARQPLLPFSVTIESMDENIDTSLEGTITLSLEDETGEIRGTLTRTTTNGVATFDDVIVDVPGVHILRAEAKGAMGAVSEAVRLVEVTELLLPRYMQGNQDATNDNNDRVPFAFRLRIEGLLPRASYRYGNRIITADDSADQNGAGNAILITGPDTDWIRNTDSPRFRSGDEGTRHLTFTTDGDGGYSGWFVTEPTGNPRFTPGNNVFVRLLLNDGEDGEDYHHYLTAPSPIEILPFAEE